MIVRDLCSWLAVELALDRLELVEDLEDRGFGIGQIVRFELAMEQVQAEGGGVQAVAGGVVQFRGQRIRRAWET